MASFIIWPVVVLILLLIFAAGSGKKQPKQKNGTAGTGKAVPRIDRPHYIDLDDHECPKCGARFRENVTVCHRCGAKLSGTTEDEDEFVEEMVLWDDD